MSRIIKHTCFILILFLMAACSSTRKLRPGQNLYIGARVQINPDSSTKIENQKEMEKTLESKTRPQPNKSFLGIKFKLLLYNLASDSSKKGISNWLRTKVGEAPVLQSEVNLPQNNAILQSFLLSKGYLQAQVSGDTVSKDRKAKAIYTAITGARYRIHEAKFRTDSTQINAEILEDAKDSFIKPRDYYDLDVFKQERERIDNQLKERGYYYFKPDYILIQADSTIGQNRVNTYVQVKTSTPPDALKPYTINRIQIYPSYSLNRDSILRKQKGVIYKDFEIIDRQQTYKPKVFERMVFFEKGDRYNRKDHNLTLNRLVNLGVFQYVKAEFIPTDSLKSQQLDLNIYLTPLKKHALTFGITGTSKSNNFVGSELSVTQTTRNVFRGAEILKLSVKAGFETQYSGQQQNVSSYSLTAEGRLSFPRFVTPFFEPKSTGAFVPKTHIGLSYQLINKANFYTLNSAKAEFGYNWKENIFKEHLLNVASITYVMPSKQTDSFKHYIDKNPVIRSSFDSLFIVGSNYTFTYNNQIESNRKNQIYFKGYFETAGNIVGNLIGRNENNERRLFNRSIAQFVKIEADLRNYLRLNKKLIWANRLNLGYGYAYGNNHTLPFVKQFFAGGSDDVRAFPARSLGPGIYEAPQDQFFADQGGDIKFLFSTELRTQLYKMFYGAVFIDAGNVWLRKEDPLKPGSDFKVSSMLNELAIGGGVGLRVDASIFVLRFDLAMPLRSPYNRNGSQWLLNQIDFGSKDWRKENLILNIGIGYPF